jgi:hypothetical protein
MAVVLNWLIGGAVILVVLSCGIYRVVSRVFDVGPRDT